MRAHELILRATARRGDTLERRLRALVLQRTSHLRQVQLGDRRVRAKTLFRNDQLLGSRVDGLHRREEIFVEGIGDADTVLIGDEGIASRAVRALLAMNDAPDVVEAESGLQE